MKRLFVLLLWIIVIFLLGLFAYQKMTGDTPNWATTRSRLQSWWYQWTMFVRKTRTMITSIGESSQHVIQHNMSWTQMELLSSWSKTMTWTIDSETIKHDIKRNNDFLNNLKTSLEVVYPAVGKGEIYVRWIGTWDYTHDWIRVTWPSWTVFYPALYNQDNAYALNQGKTHNMFSTNGIQLLDRGSGEYYIYFPSFNQEGLHKGTVLWLARGNGQMIPNLKPLLYYKNQYLFTQTDPSWTQQWLYRASNHTLEKLWNWVITDLGIDSDLIALYDKTLNTITIHDLHTMNIIKSIVLTRSDITFQWFVHYDQQYRIGYIDNQKQTMVYEER